MDPPPARDDGVSRAVDTSGGVAAAPMVVTTPGGMEITVTPPPDIPEDADADIMGLRSAAEERAARKAARKGKRRKGDDTGDGGMAAAAPPSSYFDQRDAGMVAPATHDAVPDVIVTTGGVRTTGGLLGNAMVKRAPGSKPKPKPKGMSKAAPRRTSAPAVSSTATGAGTDAAVASLEGAYGGMVRSEFTRAAPGTDNGLRKKVVPQPGFSQLDWARKLQSGEDLSGRGTKTGAVTMDEVRTHNTRDDCWTVLRGVVYNVTPYLRFHPGGIDELMRGAGDDCTPLFDETHKWVNYQHLLRNCVVGPLAKPKRRSGTSGSGGGASRSAGARAGAGAGGGDGGGSVLSDAQVAAVLGAPSPKAPVPGFGGTTGARARAALRVDDWRPFKLAARKQLTHDTHMFRFLVPAGCSFGLNRAGQHAQFRAPIGAGGADVVRDYTPVSALRQADYVDFAIKVYPKGKMGQHLMSLRAGDSVDMRGPRGAIAYVTGAVSLGARVYPVKSLVLIGAGSGITPMLQVARKVVDNSDDETTVMVVSVNHASSDIIMRKELDALVSKRSTASVVYVVSAAADDAGAESAAADETDVVVGRVDQAMLQRLLPPPAEDLAVLVCGPPAFNEVVDLALRRLYYPAEGGIIVF